MTAFAVYLTGVVAGIVATIMFIYIYQGGKR